MSLTIRAVIFAGLTLALPPARAQSSDPAVESCEMLVREEMPGSTQYRYIAAEISGSTVVLSYESGTPVMKQQKRCNFTFNASTNSWGFAPGLPDALQVAVMGALVHRGIYPIPRDMTALKP
ncbi:MAG: hypothetical protein ABWY66_04265 [Xanthobacteraceae bacterium]|jgi:hypothetical protein